MMSKNSSNRGKNNKRNFNNNSNGYHNNRPQHTQHHQQKPYQTKTPGGAVINGQLVNAAAGGHGTINGVRQSRFSQAPNHHQQQQQRPPYNNINNNLDKRPVAYQNQNAGHYNGMNGYHHQPNNAYLQAQPYQAYHHASVPMNGAHMHIPPSHSHAYNIPPPPAQAHYAYPSHTPQPHPPPQPTVLPVTN